VPLLVTPAGSGGDFFALNLAGGASFRAILARRMLRVFAAFGFTTFANVETNRRKLGKGRSALGGES